MEQRRTTAEEKWQLKFLQCIRRKPEKAVYTAKSPEFGDVILKIDLDTDQLAAEHRMLIRLKECQVYGFDEINGLLMEERILPGTALRSEPDREKRLRVFSEVFGRIHRKNIIGQDYLSWLDGIVKYCQMYLDGTELERKAKRAYYICAEMYERYPSCFLLHGDLHHDNILMRADGSYTIIDPKGVIGPAILDVPRFILNELGMGTGEDETHIRWVIGRLSKLLGYSQEEIGKVFFMETVLANIWRMEDGEVIRYDEITLAERFLI